MSRYYTPDGYQFAGNTIHPNELGSINAQLSDGYVPMSYMEHRLTSGPTVLPEQENSNTPFESTVLERLKGKRDVFKHLAELAAGGSLPEAWHVSISRESNRPYKRLLISLGEAAIEAQAA